MPSLVSNESPGCVGHEYSKILPLRIFGGAGGAHIPPGVGFQKFKKNPQTGTQMKALVE